MDNLVRINRLIIKNIKNVSYGQTSFKDTNLVSTQGAGILGVFGQNGSGKSALLDSVALFKTLASGKSLTSFDKYLVNRLAKEAQVDIYLSLQIEDVTYEIIYALSLVLDRKDRLNIKQETIKYKADASRRYKTLIKASLENNIAVIKNEKTITKMSLATNKSLLFNEQVRASLNAFKQKILEVIGRYASENILIISNFTSRELKYRDEFPLVYYAKSNGASRHYMALRYGINYLTAHDFALFKVIVAKISLVLDKIIPNINLGYIIHPSKNDKYALELVTNRDGVTLPLKFESIGVKKLVLVLGALLSMYNANNVLVVIDEIDTGIFEYLLGEMFLVLKEEGKGQLLFTSHNLRPLEILNPYQIVFTTNNPLNRYIKLKTSTKKFNLRDLYIRSIELGGEKEDVYRASDQYEISRAFRLAGADDED